MILGDNREAVIDNITRAAAEGNFHAKVEIGDPVLTKDEGFAIARGYLEHHNGMSYRAKSRIARGIANKATLVLNRDTEIVGLEKARGLTGGAIITSNHFNPMDNTIIRHMTRQLGKKRLYIISQQTNFAMEGVVGFLMRYADTIPIHDDLHYMHDDLYKILQDLMKKKQYVLIYPEQEMWFNYRKPRPAKRGAYYYAARLNVPILSCFVEQRDELERETDSFYKVRYVLHVLDPIYPRPGLSLRENSFWLCQQDYEQKRAAYEAIYGKRLQYDFEQTDIAGWIGKEAVS